MAMNSTSIALDQAIQYMKEVAVRTEEKFGEHLPSPAERPQVLHEAMRYSMFAGGKRLRPALVLAAFEVFGGQGEDIYYATSALEMFHTFSLIHDDLPCMDDDDYRRGQPTAHKKFGEATAVLSGDALCIRAFELLGKTRNVDVVLTMAQALGTYGMLGGQMIDIESERKVVDLETVDYIHYHKTAALIEASLVIGAQLAGATAEQIKPLQEYGEAIGLAFQIVDDILDIEQTTEQLGKDAGSDEARGKATYPALLGVEESRTKAKELYQQSLAALDRIPHDTILLQGIAEFIIKRVN
jgi:geranylgeranyl diphosphate synthase type II